MPPSFTSTVSSSFPASCRSLTARSQLPARSAPSSTSDKGREAARLCALNILAQAKAALRDLDRIVQLVRLNGFVNSAPGFTDHPKVLNGASDLMVEILGNKGIHTRIAIGCASLPLDAAVEVDAIFAID